MLLKIDSLDILYKRLSQSNDQIQNANKAAFFFLNFFKDFENKLVHNPIVHSNPSISKIVNSLHKDYDMHSLDFDISAYDKCISDNAACLGSMSEFQIEDCKHRINALQAEFQRHRHQNIQDEVFSPEKKLKPAMMHLKSMDSPKDLNNYFDNDVTPNEITQVDPDNDCIRKQINLQEAKTDNNVDFTIGDEGSSLFDVAGTSTFMGSPHHTKSTLDIKISKLERDIGNMVQNEAKLKGEISKLNIEQDGFKKLLEKNPNYNELKESISNISTAIMTHSVQKDVKFNQQVLFKNLIDDTLVNKLKVLEQKLSTAVQAKSHFRDMCIDQIRRSKIAYGHVTKYIEFVNNLNPNTPGPLRRMLSEIKSEISVDQAQMLCDLKVTEQCFVDLEQQQQMDTETELIAQEAVFNTHYCSFDDQSFMMSMLKDVKSPSKRLNHKQSVESLNKTSKRKKYKRPTFRSSDTSCNPVNHTNEIMLNNEQGRYLRSYLVF